ncbi:glycosyltransferase family 25 protein [Allorhizobium sp. BGMRC 0089]|uniref:glycosyltransferase family 25 protein n=1 Tax=Allorhizobium sonneratiae TaxID=2934936 RepID=UPI0020333EC6|nr:glycosyltransferase family 25 protein [Allorhizobium sonneratiae]MCM2291262.1 glycosyltransferase family 25 protein [Allorhizobium sonneratiae]
MKDINGTEIFVINLDHMTARLAFQQRQFKALGLTFERIRATKAEDAVLNNYSEAYWNDWERPIRPAERACFLSHRQLWQRIAQGSKPALILEDDAVLSDMLPAFLRRLAVQDGIDHITLETRNRRKLMATTPVEGLPIQRLYLDRAGAAAYLLWPEGARKLLKRTEKRAYIADAAICAAHELKSYQAVPALAMQIDCCKTYGLPEPAEMHTTVSSTTVSFLPGPDPFRRPPRSFRLQRIIAQIKMGLRQLSHLHNGKARIVGIESRNFAYLDKAPA